MKSPGVLTVVSHMKSMQRLISSLKTHLGHGSMLRGKTGVLKVAAPRVASASRDSLFARLQTFFLHNKLASMTMLFAFAMPATVGTASLSMDYANISYAKGKLQAAMASSIQAGIQTALREIVDTSTSTFDPTSDALTRGYTSAQNTFLNNLGTVPNLTLNSVTPVVWRDGQTLRATLSYTATMATPMWAMYGTSSVILSNSTTSQIGFPQVANGTYIISENFASYSSSQTLATYLKSFNNWKATGWDMQIGQCENGGLCYSAPASDAGSSNSLAFLRSFRGAGMTKRVSLPVAGTYELRYKYMSLIDYPIYDPMILCGSTNQDLVSYNQGYTAWYNWYYGSQTNRLEVYLDPAPTDTPPVNPATGTMTPTHNNMIDACAYAGVVNGSNGFGTNYWIQRSVPITVTMPGYYWLTFQSAGDSSGKGAGLDDIQLCPNTCPGSVPDTYPFTPGQKLFYDNFTTPYTGSIFGNCAVGAQGCGWNPSGWGWGWGDGTLDQSGTNLVWGQLDAGWQTSPWNQMDFNQVTSPGSWGFPSGATPAGNHVALDMDASQYARTISRKFLLDPGYYEIDYTYAQRFYPFDSVITGTYCASQTDVTTSSSVTVNPGNSPATNAVVNKAFFNAGSPTSDSNGVWTDVIEVSVDPDALVSHPVTSAQFYGVTTYQNPDGSAASLPSTQPVNGYLVSTYSVGPDGKSLPYLPTASGVVDACFYATNPTQRKVPIKITKAGYYWISFSAGDNPNGFFSSTGPELADIAFYALGGLSTGNTNSATQNSAGQVKGTDGVYRTPNIVRAAPPVASLNTESVTTSSSAVSGYQISYSGALLGFTIPAQ